MFPDSYFATVLGWFTVLMLGLTLYNVYVEEKGRTLIFLLAAFFGGFGWFYAKTRAQSNVLLTPEPVPITAASRPPMPVWCEESPTKNCALEACLASIKDDKPTFVLLGAEWCGPCQTVKMWIRLLDKPKETLAKFRTVHIDVDANPGVAALYPNEGAIPAGVILGKSCEVTHLYVGDGRILDFFKYPPAQG